MSAEIRQSPPRRMNEIGDESRQRLLDAAEELFLEKGFEGTTVVEIGKRAGISHGSIPWHFGNKAGILYAVVVRLFDVSSSPGPLETGQMGFNQLWKEQTYFDESPKFPLFGPFFMTEISRPGTHRDEISMRHFGRLELITDWINRSQEADSLQLALPARNIAEFWVGASRGIFVQKVGFIDAFDLPSARQALGFSIDSLLGSTYFQNLDTSL